LRQLTGLDAYWLGLEDARTQGHVSCVATFDPASAPSGRFGRAEVRQLILDRHHLVAPFRWRLMEVPFALDYPYWYEDAEFDVDFHVRELALARPGDDSQLAEQVARIFARPLDRARPLWEVYVIEGLERGRVALLTKIHHAAVDGMSGAEILAALFDLAPEGREIPPPPRRSPRSRSAPPSQLEMLGRGALGSTIRPWRAASALPGMARFAAWSRSREAGQLPASGPSAGPEVPFGGRIGPHRRLAFATLSLADVKAAKNAHGTTVNDVVVALVAGTLRRWLLARDALPSDPLVCTVPISVRTPEEAGTFGNKVSVMTVGLPTQLDEPVARLQAAHEALSAAKERHNATPATVLQDAQHFLPPAAVASASRVIGALAASPLRVFPNVNVTNVPGPPIPIYCAGAQLERLYAIAPIFDTIPMNFAVMSYRDELNVCVVGDRDKLPDPEALLDGLSDELAELLAAGGG
jgi:WS/DGAT/MGAT family acyltransferase